MEIKAGQCMPPVIQRSRNKKNKVHTIHSYKDLERNSLTAFEALVADYSEAEIVLGNSYKALVIFLNIYKIDALLIILSYMLNHYLNII
jgi:hypothetical protein